MKGKIITIEGLDGAGKSTQINLLVNQLQKYQIPHQFIHFPMLNQGYYGTLIAEFLRGEFGAVDAVHPKLVALLFAEDRKEHIHKINQWLNDGYLVILDRYVNSNIAFQCAKTKEFSAKKALKDWILDFEFNYNQLPQPDVSFYLHVPFDITKQSLQQNREGEDRSYLMGKTDIHEGSMELQKGVYEEYLSMLQEQDNFFEIPCFSSENAWLKPEEIHEIIITKIKSLFPNLFSSASKSSIS